MIKKFENFIGDSRKSINKPINKPINRESETGKEHSLRYDDDNIEFAEYLRQNFYNVKLSNYDVYQLKKNFENENKKI